MKALVSGLKCCSQKLLLESVILVSIIIIIIPNIFLAHAPAGAESDLNAAAAAPSQTEVTDLNCSDQSTTSKKKRRVASFVESPSDTHSRSDSTIHYGVTAILQPTTIATQKKWHRRREERRKTVREGWDLISTIEGSKSRGEIYYQTSSHSYTRWC